MAIEMLANLLKGIDATEIHAFVRAIKSPADYELTNTVMPVRTLNSVKWRTKQTKRRIAAAKYRTWDSTTPIGSRELTKTVTEGMLPPLGQKFIIGELEQILLDTSRGMDDGDIIERLYDDIAAHVTSIRSRLELAVGDLLTDGKFTLAGENGMYTEYDAQVPAANMPTAAVPWTDPTADMIGDERKWIEYLRSIGAPLPARVLTSYKARALMQDNQSYRAAYYGAAPGATLPTAVLAQTEVDVVRARYGLPPITIYDVPIPLDNGTDVRALPENLYILLPPNPTQWAETQYGVTAEALVLSNGSNPSIIREEAPGIIVTHGYSDDPPQVWTKGSAAAMPVMYVPDIHITAKVW
ncbi:major capsid protein [Kitasatospora sp. NPDC087315]|uniref:major capsid protein n=1 Tax=Kitasatospora sp. NPDC087315 TaxID=3364069 RepID=UPI003825F7D9